MRRVETCVILVLVLMAPMVSATGNGVPSEGAFASADIVSIQSQVVMDGAPVAFFLNGDEDVNNLHLDGSFAIHEREVDFLQVTANGQSAGPETGSTNHDYTFHQGVMTMTPPRGTGWIGVYPMPGSRFHAQASDWVSFTPAALTDVGNTQNQEVDQGDPGIFGYHRTITGPHLVADFAGTITVQAPFDLKIEGGDLNATGDGQSVGIHTAHEVSGVPTGFPAGAAQTRTEHWVYVEVPHGQISFTHTTHRASLVLGAANATWDGRMLLKPFEGQLKAGNVQYAATPAMSTIDGRFQSRIETEIRQDSPLAMLSLGGDLRTTTLSGRISEPISTNSPMSMSIFAILFGSVVTVGVGVGITRAARRASRERLRMEASSQTPEECLAQAEAAFARRAWGEAVHWARLGRSTSPAHGPLWMIEARAQRKLGKMHDAMAAYRMAMSVTSDGEAEREAIEFLSAIGAHDHEIDEITLAYQEKKRALLVVAGTSTEREMNDLLAELGIA